MLISIFLTTNVEALMQKFSNLLKPMQHICLYFDEGSMQCQYASLLSHWKLSHTSEDETLNNSYNYQIYIFLQVCF